MKKDEKNLSIFENCLQKFLFFTGLQDKHDKQTQNKEKNLILKAIADAKEELYIANNSFEYASGSSYAKVSIYRVKAAEEKYMYLLDMAKSKNISL